MNTTDSVSLGTDIHDGPTITEAVIFAGRLGVDLSDFMSACVRLIGEARDKAPRELHRSPEVTVELMERDI